MATASIIVESMRSRGRDGHGSGQYGAPRGTRRHQGLDIVAKPLEFIYAPISGRLTRDAFPYKNDPTYRGAVITGTGEWEGYEIKIFYMVRKSLGNVEAGDFIGFAQDISAKYPGITNHIHIEVKYNGLWIDPRELWGMCF